MFLVTDAERETIAKALREGGEFDAMLAVQRIWKGIGPDQARETVRAISGWKAIPPKPKIKRRQVSRSR